MRMPPGISARWASRTVYFALTFGLYWLTSFVLEGRNAMTHFGADAHVYTLLADGIVVDGLARFHPVTIAMAMAWMKILSTPPYVRVRIRRFEKLR